MGSRGGGHTGPGGGGNWGRGGRRRLGTQRWQLRTAATRGGRRGTAVGALSVRRPCVRAQAHGRRLEAEGPCGPRGADGLQERSMQSGGGDQGNTRDTVGHL